MINILVKDKKKRYFSVWKKGKYLFFVAFIFIILYHFVEPKENKKTEWCFTKSKL